ncbi:flagellar hook-length control protein FliK [Treponema socranskii]|uniref:flagellar hook-length control protein FliK n=1 Tax=Treponema socranskii TaxID=53419 RepID=UPI0023F0CBDB|nr:flagellar hook-length control protein FliK [Treponema socranskii]
MQGSPVAKLSAVPKVNAIDKIDSLPSQLSKKILLSRTKNEEHSFAKLLARAQGKKIDAQVSDVFSGAGLSARGKSESLSRSGGKAAHGGAFEKIRARSAEHSSARNAKSDMLLGANGLRESKRAFTNLRREDVSKTKPVRNDAADTKKESKTAAAKDISKKETIDAAKNVVKKQHDDTSSDFNEKKSFEYTQDESRGKTGDAEMLEKAEVVDGTDAARAALLQDFAYLVDGSRDFEIVRVGNAEAGGTAESDADDFFAESLSVSEEAVPFQIGSAVVHTTDLSDGETEGGEFSDNGFSDDKAFSFEINDDAVLSKRERAFDADGKILVTDLRTETAEILSEVKPESEKLIKLDAANGASSELTMFVSESVRQNVFPANGQSTQAASSNFQTMLANQIRQNASDFVKAGSIVLRDNNAGTINLVLRPESFGNVKISLQLSDKVVSGQITVHSEEAYNAFKESADALKTAFAQSGFEAGGFTVAYSSAGTGGSFSGSETGEGFADARHAGRYEDVFVPEESAASGGSYIAGEHAVNVIV